MMNRPGLECSKRIWDIILIHAIIYMLVLPHDIHNNLDPTRLVVSFSIFTIHELWDIFTTVSHKDYRHGTV